MTHYLLVRNQHDTEVRNARVCLIVDFTIRAVSQNSTTALFPALIAAHMMVKSKAKSMFRVRRRDMLVRTTRVRVDSTLASNHTQAHTLTLHSILFTTSVDLS